MHFGTQGTACLTLDGKIKWKTNELVYRPVHGNGGSPVLVDDKLVIICDGAAKDFVVALNKATGKIVWKTNRTVKQGRMFAFSTPLLIHVEGQQQLVCAGAGAVVAYRPNDGKAIWQVDYPEGYSVIPRPVYGHGLVYICTGYGTPNLLAIRPAGQGNVTATHVKWTSRKSIPHSASPLLVEDELYFVSDRGTATCVDAQTGRVHWTQRLGGGFSTSPVYADDKIYFQNEAGTTTVIAPGTAYEELGRNDLNARTLASFAIAESALFVRTQTELFRIED